jgi:hypothetical protein
LELGDLNTIPENVTFSNSGWVDLESITELPKGTIFSNSGDIQFGPFVKFNKGVRFQNLRRDVYTGTHQNDSLRKNMGDSRNKYTKNFKLSNRTIIWIKKPLNH